MIPRVVCCLLTLFSIAVAAEQADSKVSESVVRVECVGKLRHGQVAIGGETTGTTITFDGTTWELKLSTAESRDQAEKLHKKPVTVTGTLRHVRGVEVPSRWIVDVEKLAESDLEPKGDVKTESANIALVGVLKRQADQVDSSTGAAGASVTVGGITWRLDFGDNRELESKSKALDGKLVSAQGVFVRAEASKQGGPMNVRVNSLGAASTK